MQQVAELSAAFDARYYLASYPDVAEAGLDPLTHYCTFGWQEGRNPSAEFDTRHYLARNPDVAKAQINPLLHYVSAGRAEGRSPRPHAAPIRRQLLTSWWAAGSVGQKSGVPLLGAPRAVRVLDLLSALKAGTTGRGVVISVSHDDYRVSVGGVQNIIGDEAAEFRRRGLSYLHLCPARPCQGLAPDVDAAEFEFAVRLDGEALGRIDGSALQQVLHELRRAEMPVMWLIHHLMGHSTALLRQLIDAWRPMSPRFWTHDFFADCASYTLLRNGLAYCGSPPPTSAACRVCSHGDHRLLHRQRIEEFVRGVSPRLVAPSQRALDLWIDTTGIEHLESEVVPPATLLLDRRPLPLPSASPLRVAFVGAPVFHKGWNIFERLAEAFRDDPRYRFHQFGATGAIPKYIRHTEVRVSIERRGAMTEALVAEGIHVAVIWSQWPETFCFTAHEALAAGAFVVFRGNQGHVDVAMAHHAPQGAKALSDERSLFHYFRSGQIGADLSKAVLRRGVLIPSTGSAETFPTEVTA